MRSLSAVLRGHRRLCSRTYQFASTSNEKPLLLNCFRNKLKPPPRVSKVEPVPEERKASAGQLQTPDSNHAKRANILHRTDTVPITVQAIRSQAATAPSSAGATA